VTWIAAAGLTVISAILVVFFGPYTVRLRFLRDDSKSLIALRLRSLVGFFGMDCEMKPECFHCRLAVFGKVWNRDFRIKGIETESASSDGSGSERKGITSKVNAWNFNSARTLKIIMKFFKRILHAFRLKRLDADVSFGTGNPATTGILYGWIQCLNESTFDRFEATFKPDFFRKKFHGKIELTVRFFLIKLVLSALIGGFEVFLTSRSKTRSLKRRFSW
jgi:hypothetical protein